VRDAWAAARLSLRVARRRSLVTAAGVFAASLLLGTAVTVAYGLHTGFDRAAARADLPDITARFDRRSRADVARRVRALPGIEASSYRFEVSKARFRAPGHRTGNGSIAVVGAGRRGYAITAGRDVHGGAGEIVVERGLARAWNLHVGGELVLGRLGAFRIAGIGVAPDNVAFPLTAVAHIWIDEAYFDARFGPDRVPQANVALVWLKDRALTPTVLQQARASSFGVTGLRFVTRDGVRVLLDEAAGIVVALLGAVSLVGLVAAGVLLASGAQAEAQRRLATLGVQRAIGFAPGTIAAGWALAALALALPAGAAGLAAGAWLSYGPASGLMESLNELAPGAALLGPLAIALAGLTALVTASTLWPTWRAARRSPATLLRGAEIPPARRLRRLPSGPGGLGVRLVTARRGRIVTSTVVLAVTGAVLVLMLALATLLQGLRDDPGSLGRRYDLGVFLPASFAGEVAAVPGVQAVAVRYTLDAADSFSLGEPLRIIAYDRDHVPYEAPPLAAGRRARGPGEAEVGQGLSDALGVHPGGTFAAQLPGGTEVRFRVAGIVRALEHDGRVAYVSAAPILAAQRNVAESIVVRLDPGASAAAVQRAITARTGATSRRPAAATTSNTRFLGTLATLVRALAGAIAGVCLYALAQTLGLVARERRPAIAVLRAGGAGMGTVARLLAGAALAVAIPAAAVALVLERFVLGPAVTRLAAGYADLSLVPTAGQVALLLGGFAVLGVVASAWVARGAVRESIVTGLRAE
jgi:ABC-type lipoprotein release transport system permease subunit